MGIGKGSSRSSGLSHEILPTEGQLGSSEWGAEMKQDEEG